MVKHYTRGIEIEFENNDRDEVIGIDFRSFDLAEHENFRKRLPEWQIIASIIKSGGPMECTGIAKEAQAIDPDTKIDAKRAYDAMKKKPNHFVQVPRTKSWGLVNNGFI